tara:strand:+ start:23973 stop:24431 length:459 start_codon:yes stop_codon:yes gene_type:complete
MNLQPIEYPSSIRRSEENRSHFQKFDSFLEELRRMELPPEVIVSLNNQLEKLHSFSGSEKQFFKKLKITKAVLLKILYKEVHVVPKNHYRNLWIALGLSAIGIPVGILLSLYLDNSIYIALGIALGSTMGVLIGNYLDNQAEEEGRQIEIYV